MINTKSNEQKKVTLEWDEMAGDWDDLACGYRNSLLRQIEDEHLLSSSDELVVLDFGCGSGLLTEKLHPRVKKVVCIDASRLMVEQVAIKIKASQWENVVAYSAILSEPESIPEDTKKAIDELKGKVDLVIASSVLSFIPDLENTIKVLSSLMKPGARFCHSDWPKSESAPAGFTEESALAMYASGDMVANSVKEIDLAMGRESARVFWGVATKECDSN